jgi:hypothetical protein
MKCLTFLPAALALLAQDKDRQRPRGQSGPPDESQSWTRGRLGTHNPIPGKLITMNGILIDASCDDRTAMNLARPPEKPPAEAADTHGAHAGSADRSENAHVHPSDDRTCAVTKGTRSFAFLMTEGRLLNLDEGGNTMVVQALSANPDGRAMLSGEAAGIKPRVSLRGRVHGDRFIVEKIVKL